MVWFDWVPLYSYVSSTCVFNAYKVLEGTFLALNEYFSDGQDGKNSIVVVKKHVAPTSAGIYIIYICKSIILITQIAIPTSVNPTSRGLEQIFKDSDTDPPLNLTFCPLGVLGRFLRVGQAVPRFPRNPVRPSITTLSWYTRSTDDATPPSIVGRTVDPNPERRVTLPPAAVCAHYRPCWYDATIAVHVFRRRRRVHCGRLRPGHGPVVVLERSAPTAWENVRVARGAGWPVRKIIRAAPRLFRNVIDPEKTAWRRWRNRPPRGTERWRRFKY